MKKSFDTTVSMKNKKEFYLHIKNVKKNYGLRGKVKLSKDSIILKEMLNFPFEFISHPVKRKKK